MYTQHQYSKYSVGAIKLLYFLIYVGMAAWSTQFYAFLERERALSGVKIGTLAAVQQINNLIVLPVWGMISDRYGKRKVFLILLALASVSILGFLYHGGFWFYFAFIIFFTAINNPLAALIDSFALEKSSQAVVTEGYGNMRLWASFGWAVSSIATGALIRNTELSFSVIFIVTSVFYIMTWGVAYTSLNKKHERKTTKTPSLGTLVGLFSQNRKLLYFFLFCLMYYIFNAPILNMINIYYSEICDSYFPGLSEDDLNAKIGFIVGIAFAVQSLFELPFMFYAENLIQRFGRKNIIIFTMFVAVVRMFFYGFSSNPYVSVVVGCLHGITLGLFWVAAVGFVHKLVPPGQNSTGQMVFNTFLGVGTCLGNLLTGYMKDTISLQYGMRINALVILILVVVGVVFSKRVES